jgi:putative FmdB family regulatory protein
MPIYEYQSSDEHQSCEYCRDGFEALQKISDAPLQVCPQCGATVIKLISAPAVGASKSGFDDRAKSAGFHKLKKVSTGEYEKMY